MSTNDLVLLVKGLTLAERTNRWIGGSVSSVIWTFRHVQRRDPMLADELADWILPRTRNPYVPYGGQSHGARTAAEYRQIVRDRSDWIACCVAKVAGDNRRAADEREVCALQRARSAENRHDPVRQALIEELNTLPLRAQLHRLANDLDYSVEFYPTRLANRAKGAVASLPEDVRLALLRKLKGKRRGPWKRLRTALLDTFRSGAFDRSTPWDRAAW